jgi:pSer/pThr/pTyr-binding forkhead associated (FHA) protein
MGVSRRHFSITPVQGGYLLRDESANGTLINGSRVSGTYLLGHGDLLRLDEEDLRFELDGAAAPETTEAAAPTAILDMSRIRREFAAGDKRESQSTSLAAHLEIVRGPYAGASFPIERPVCSIGRGPQCDVRVRDDSVSTNHATLLRKGASWFVVDLRSANGTFVDGLRIAGERELAAGSRLKLGSVEMVFRSFNSDVEVPLAKRKTSWLKSLLTLLTERSVARAAPQKLACVKWRRRTPRQRQRATQPARPSIAAVNQRRNASSFSIGLRLLRGLGLRPVTQHKCLGVDSSPRPLSIPPHLVRRVSRGVNDARESRHIRYCVLAEARVRLRCAHHTQ